MKNKASAEEVSEGTPEGVYTRMMLAGILKDHLLTILNQAEEWVHM